MKRYYVQINGVLYERGTEPQPKEMDCHHVMPDIKPYKSMITGEMITSRSQHRDHLRQHGCEEIGNETKYLMEQKQNFDVNPEGRKELIRAQVDAMSQREFKQAIRRDVERIKWNSRG